MTLFVVAYHLILILLAYAAGRKSAGPGVAIFIGGIVLFQLFALGPASFIAGGCERYSFIAQDC